MTSDKNPTLPPEPDPDPAEWVSVRGPKDLQEPDPGPMNPDPQLPDFPFNPTGGTQENTGADH